MDPNQNQYASDMVVQLLALCRKTFGSFFSTYRQGLPSTPLTDVDYPACIVQKMDGNYDIGDTTTDDEQENVVIMLFSNKADDIGSANDPGVTTLRKLQNLVEGKIASPGNTGWFQYAPNTLLYAIRTNMTLNQTVIKSAVKTSYDVNPRVDENGKPTTGITEAIIMLTAKEIILVPGRS